mgnify:CR=1 FL=1|jgi:hypothetical protein
MEKEDVFDICEKMEPKIKKYMKKHYPDAYKEYFSKTSQEPVKPKEESPKVTLNESEGNSDEIPLEPIEPKNKDLKTIYRKIVEKTHPDKTGDNSHAGLFSEAARAYKNNNMGKLIEIATKANIEVPNIGKESIYILESNIKEIEEEIKHKKQTTSWGWHRAKNDKQKKDIVKAIFASRGIKNG